MTDNNDAKQVEQLLEIPNLADALESDRFKQFLDHIPFAVAVSELQPIRAHHLREHRVRAADRPAGVRVARQAMERAAGEA